MLSQELKAQNKKGLKKEINWTLVTYSVVSSFHPLIVSLVDLSTHAGSYFHFHMYCMLIKGMEYIATELYKGRK